MKIKNLKIIISYDGSNYLGWQRLGKEQSSKTIQGILENVLEEILPEGRIKGKKYEIIGSGRTDTGVHAQAQVANVFIFKTVAERYPILKKLQDAMNKRLPEDIRIKELEWVNVNFHSRYSAVSKIYEYNIDTREKADVFRRKYMLSFTEPLSVEKMRSGAEYFIGKHDFEAFSSKMKDGRSTICNIEWIKIKEENNRLQIQIKGDGFLYHMVRIMVGTLILVGTGEKKPEEICSILKSKNRTLAGPLISSKGLCLKEVLY